MNPFELAEAFQHMEVEYHLRTASGGTIFKKFKIGDLMLGRYDDQFELEGYYHDRVPILRKK